MHIRIRTIAAIALALGLSMMWTSVAAAQVRIDMPPPPKKSAQPVALPSIARTADERPATITTSTSTTTSAAAALAVSVVSPDVGDVALTRYSSARRGTYDTYMNDGSYWNGGIRTYSYPRYYPQYIWGPWYGGFFPGIGFHHSFNCW